MNQKSIHHSCFSHEIDCANCGYTDKGLYCSNCGSPFNKERISLTALSIKLVSVLVNIEGRYANTSKELFIRPVNFILRYLNGERERFYVPFKFLLINLTINFFIYNYFNISQISEFQNFTAGDEALLHSEVLFDHIISQYGKFFFLLIIPFYAICSKILHPKTRFNAAEIATAISFMLGQMMLLEIILNLLSALYSPFYFIQKYLVIVTEVAIVFILCYRFFENRLIHAIWKTVVTLTVLVVSMKYVLILTQFILHLLCGE
ncbi:MAG: DUF3667 domain-containing protein [Saprospiraceae bacterium]|nr:DUF3667 domain-containing protein [Saprospiraceae bacterium]